MSNSSIPTMTEILTISRQESNLDLKLKTVGPFFRVTAKNMETQNEVGKAAGVVRVWFDYKEKGKILHLDSIKLERETIWMEKKSLFGVGLFIGAVAIRHGFDSGCRVAQLLAIYDSDLYHSKLVRFYKRLGFEEVHEVSGSTMGDLAHMLVWGGVGTRMDADIEALLMKWGSRFKRQ